MIPSRYRGIEKTQKESNAVLEQIRAEIEDMRNKVKPLDDFSDRGMYADGKIAAYDYVLQIIDKYK
jgi:hypothetical protein